jgi:hypothetical protein
MMRISNVKKKMMKNLLILFEKKMEEEIQTLKAKKHFNMVDWIQVKKIANVSDIKKFIYKTQELKKLDASRRNLGADTIKFDDSDLIVEARHRALTNLKGLYWELFSSGQCTSEAVLILIESVDRAIDHENVAIEDWAFFKDYFHSPKISWLLNKGTKIPLIGRLFTNELFRRLSYQYDIAITFVEAHEETIHLMKDMLENKTIANMLLAELKKNLDEAETYMTVEIEMSFGILTGAI